MKYIIAVLFSFIIASGANAASLEVEADNSIEWHRDTEMYIAKGNAKATQNGRSIIADSIYAHYKKTEVSDMDIWKLEAKENVLIEDNDTKIIGDTASYLVKKGEFIVEGESLDVLFRGYQIKADDKIEYFEKEGEVIATGNIRVYQGDNELHCDRLIAYLTKNAGANNEVSELFAYGNVVIKTPTDKITGEEGYYNTKQEIAEVQKNVIISRENSVITGGKATVNMKTGIAKMVSTKQGEKVKAIFVSEDKE